MIDRRHRLTALVSVPAAVALAVVVTVHAHAQLASRPADEWVKVLDADERLASLNVSEIVTALSLKPGEVIADLGTGSGPFVVPFANAVSPKGRVYAVDVDSKFFPYVDKRVKAAGVANVRTVLGAFADPRLPAADVDVAFMHDVLHHVEDRAGYLKAVATYVKPGGRIALIDFHPASSPHSDQPALQIGKEQAAAWLTAAGFTPARDLALFKEKWFLIYTRAR